jgi:hypothetical protein
MVHDRGYKVPKEDLELTIAQWEQRRVDRSQLLFVANKVGDDTEQIIVFFPDEEPIGITIIRK